MSGQKRVEFRRTWAANQVGLIVIYSSSPIQRIVATIGVDEVVSASPSKLWSYCGSHGGGLTRRELFKYFDGKAQGYAVLLREVRVLHKPIEPQCLFEPFTAPQSFRYLTVHEVMNLEKLAAAQGSSV